MARQAGVRGSGRPAAAARCRDPARPDGRHRLELVQPRDRAGRRRAARCAMNPKPRRGRRVPNQYIARLVEWNAPDRVKVFWLAVASYHGIGQAVKRPQKTFTRQARLGSPRTLRAVVLE